MAISWLASGLVDSIAGRSDDLGPAGPGDPAGAIAGGATQVTPYVRIGGLVCAPELTALAYSIMAVRRPGDPGYQGAAGVADSLLAMAASPFPV